MTEQGYRYNIVDATLYLPDLPVRLAAMQAEFEEKKERGGEAYTIDGLREKANRRGKPAENAGTRNRSPEGANEKANRWPKRALRRPRT